MIKECSKCGKTKDHSEFAKKRKSVSSVCKMCHNAYYKAYYADPENRKKHVERVVRSRGPRYRQHGLSKDQFELLKTKSGLCPICDKRPQAVIDHDHDCCPGPLSCGKCVRGFICTGCNTGLGWLGDTADTIYKAYKYLKERNV
jgi:Recombination endonuclease VII